MNQTIKTEVSGNTTSTANTEEPIIIAIDHGYGNIKTSNFCFPANVTPINDGLCFTDDILIYDGATYAIGMGHKEFRADKIMDQDYYLLTLAAIGKELDRRGMTKATIVIAAGLPLTWGIEQKKSFQEYLTQKKHVDFSYKSIVYHVDVQEAMIFNQGIAAVANLINKSFRGTNMLVDIGNGTMNVMNINEKTAILESCFTEKYGTYQCVIRAREMLQRKFGSLPTDAQIEKYLRSMNADIGEKYKAVIQETARQYVAEIFRRLREHEYDPDLMRLWVIGGGGCLVKNFGVYDADRVIFIEDLRANAKGYERMARRTLEKRRAKDEHQYANAENYQALTYENTLMMKQELAPLIVPDDDDAKALRFDALMYGIELAYLVGKKYGKARSDLMKKVAAVAKVANIPEIEQQAELIDKILHTDYVDNAGINEFEHIREKLRDLIKYIPITKIRYDTDMDDEVLSIEWNESNLESDDLRDYRAKAEYYIRQHQDNGAIAKLRGNVPLTSTDIEELEKILWSEVGSRQDYEAEYGQKPLGELVREIVGMDMAAAKAAFSEFLEGTNLDSRQIYFVNQIVEYIVQNGMMKDLSVLQQPPFTDQGNIVELFSTNLGVWNGIRKAIERVNANALAA